MGIGPWRWDGRRALCGGITLGVVAAGFVLGGGALPPASAKGTGATFGAAAARLVTGTEGHRTRSPHSTAAVHTDKTGAHVQASSTTLHATVVGVAADETGGGYWEVASDGDLYAAGNAVFHGSMEHKPLAARVVGLVADPATGGYWEVGADGGVFSFGDARFYGSMGGHHLKDPIVGMASTPNGKGYWEVSADGGIFSFGDARFYGSMGGRHLKDPIVGMASTPKGKGYWEVSADGGIFSFGDARFYGSMGGRHLKAQVVAMTADPAGGYWEVQNDGGVFSFGAPLYGSTSGRRPTSPITGLAATPQGKGYWEVAADGHIYSFGRARFAGAAKVTLPGNPNPNPNPPPSNPSADPSPKVTVAAAPNLPPSNPSANIAPVPAYTFESNGNYSSTTSLPCWQLGTSAWIPQPDAQCVAAEVAATDNARADEGLTPLSLPSDYSSLTAEEQLFVLTDIERVSRGEQPAVGLSSLVDSYAQVGAETSDDPQFSFSAIPSSDWWGSNVVSGALNALDANYTWMYEDGYGGYNVDCTSPSSSGCWGHRDNELTSAYGGTLVMGAGDVELHTGLQCLSELFVAVQDPSDLPPLYYTWADAVAAGAAG